MAAKIGLAGPILAAKVVGGTSFGKILWQNQSGRTDFRRTDFHVTGQIWSGPTKLMSKMVAPA